MSVHSRCTILFILLLGGLFLADRSFPVPTWSYLVLAASYLTLVIIGSTRIDSGYHLNAICHGRRDGDRVYLSFDDGPDPEVTPKVLDLLKERDLKAAFFLIGHKVEAHPGIVERIHREGHWIGGHSWSHHFLFDLFSSSRMQKEIAATTEAIQRVTGERPEIFRPPYGVSNPMLRKAVKRSGVYVIGWDLRSFDTSRSPQRTLHRIRKRIRAGSVVLLHDTNEGSERILEELLALLDDKGLRVSDPRELLDEC